jgi:gas vesicle protein
MKSLNHNISTRFFGLNKTDVNKYLKGLVEEQEKALEELFDELNRLTRERDALLSELEESKKDEVRYEDDVVGEDSVDSKVINEAYNRLDKTIALINMVADEEASQLAQNANKKLEEYDQVIEKLQEDITDKKKKIESLLSDVLGLLKANMEEVTSKHKKDSERKKLDFETEEYNRKASSLFEEEELESKIEEIKNDKITADGTSVNGLPKLLMFQKKYGVKPDEALNKLAEREKSVFDEEDDLHDVKDSSAPPDRMSNYFEDLSGEEEYENPVKTPAPQPAADDGNINKMRNALIIGKIAGEDITDKDNNVVIHKGKVLTEEDIALAEMQGKLPELIINMWLPK